VESLDDPEYKIFRPRQIFIGEKLRPYEGFTVPAEGATPALDSNDPKTIRPVGAQANLDFEGALNSIYDELGNIDFTANVDPTVQTRVPRFSKLGHWVKKTFGVADPSDMSGDMVEKLKVELEEIKSRQDQIQESLKKVSKNHELIVDEKRARVPSSSRTADIDIMAGSNYSRVIAPK
jgi:hypothetical protein